MMHMRKKGQSAVEYAILFVIVMGAFVAASTYIKRGIQGRWRDSVDGLGSQYDPRVMQTAINHTLVSESRTIINTIPDEGGYWTMREDVVNSIESKTGETHVDGYY